VTPASGILGILLRTEGSAMKLRASVYAFSFLNRDTVFAWKNRWKGCAVCLDNPFGVRNGNLGHNPANDPREVISEPHARYFGGKPSERILVSDDDARLGKMCFENCFNQPARQIPNTRLQPSASGA